MAETCVAKELPRRLNGAEERPKIHTVHLRSPRTSTEILKQQRSPMALIGRRRVGAYRARRTP